VKARAALATTIVLFSLVMGVFWGTWFSLSRTMDQLSGETFVAVGHQMIQNLGMPMAVIAVTLSATVLRRPLDQARGVNSMQDTAAAAS